MKDRIPVRIAWALACAACLSPLGCGGVYDSSVSGVVTLDGSPVPRGTVTFSPEGTGPTAYGQIQSDGAYQLRTGKEEGLPPGQYTVTVIANEPPAEARSKTGGPAPMGKPITPDWYRDPAQSGLSFPVNDGENEINLELTSTPPAGYVPPRTR